MYNKYIILLGVCIMSCSSCQQRKTARIVPVTSKKPKSEGEKEAKPGTANVNSLRQLLRFTGR